MNLASLKSNWSTAKAKLKERYDNLTDNDLAYIEGRPDEMFGQIQRKTGISREELEHYLRQECCCGV
jgi:uncharacterized protein YjbJ (UPF0337 family)